MIHNISILRNPKFLTWGFTRKKYFSAARLELIVEESNDDFEDVPDYVEGQNDLQESRGEDDSKIINESNANDSDTNNNSRMVNESNAKDSNNMEQQEQAVRAVVLTAKGLVKVVTTSNFKAVNDGGDVNPNRVMENFVRREFPADGGHRLKPIIEESNDDFEDVPDYIEGQYDLQESRGEDDSRIVNKSNANDSDTAIDLKLVQESNVHDLNTNDQLDQIVAPERPGMENPKQRIRKEINRED